MKDQEKWFELADLYAVGSLDERETAEFLEHLKSSPELLDYLTENEQALTAFPKALVPVAPPSFVKARLMQQIESEVFSGAGAAAAPGFSLNWATGLVMACLVVALGATVIQTRQKMMSYKEVSDELAQPDTQVVAMKPLEAAQPISTGKMIWNPKNCTGIFMAMNLPQLPTDKEYQLWAISGSETIPAGVFKVDEDGCAKFDLKGVPQNKTIDKFAVTLEPIGGVPAPTGAMYLLGTV